MKRSLPAVGLFACLFLCGSHSLHASSGDLDLSFDTDGKTTFNVSGDSCQARGVVVQADGKIVVGGINTPNNQNDFALVRFNSDGSVDDSYGTNGSPVVDFLDFANGQGMSPSDDNLESLALQSDGKVVAGGETDVLGATDFALVRFDTDGSLDAGFGSGGAVILSLGNSDKLASLAIQEDGKILAAGASFGVSADTAVLRFNPDGTPDAGFGANGAFVLDFGGNKRSDAAFAVLPLAGGKILLAGTTAPAFISSDFTLIRLNSEGTLDTTFGINGKVQLDVGTQDSFTALAVQADGKILAGGTSLISNQDDIVLARFNPDGSQDASFGIGGVKTLDALGLGQYDFLGFSLFVQADGRILAIGSAGVSGGTSDFAIIRFLTNGDLDASFGSGGVATTDFFKGSIDAAFDAALLPDGRIIAVGGDGGDFAVARYLGNTADLSITATVDATSVKAGATLTYTLSVTNAGPDAAGGVVVTDALPAGVTLNSTTPTQGTCSGTTSLNCDFGTVAQGATASVAIAVTPNGGGTLSSSAASVAAQVVDPVSNNNSGMAPDVTVAGGGPGGGCSLVR